MISKLHISSTLTATAFLLAASPTMAEKFEISAENVTLIANSAIEEHMGRKALVLGTPPGEGVPATYGLAVLNGVGIEDGTIQYDVHFNETRTFAGINFRMQDKENYEEFYMRAHQSGNPDANQYMPRFNGMPNWQLYYGASYAAPVTYTFDDWTSVRLVISGQQADIFIGDMEKPAYSSVLVRDVAAGGISLWGLNLGGPAWISNIQITPDADVKLVGTPIVGTLAGDGAVMNWQVSDAFDGAALAGKTSLDGMADAHSYSALKADARGIADLSRIQGVSDGSDTVFSRITITAEKAGTHKFNLGFSDIARVFLNGELLFEAADQYSTRDYRFLGTVGLWDSVILRLDAGDNDLTIAVTESVSNKTGWAVMGEFESLDGLSIN